MITDRYIDDIINDGQEVKGKNSDDVDKIVETLALKIDNKIDAALKKIDEKLADIDNKEDNDNNDNKDDNDNNDNKDDNKDIKDDKGGKEDE